MSYITYKLPPVELVVISGGNLIFRTNTYNGFVSLSRTDTIRRKKPVGLDLIALATSVYTDWQKRVDGQYIYREPGLEILGPVNDYMPLGYETPGEDEISRLRAKALNKFRSKLRSTSVNLGLMLAEYKQTANLFNDLSKRAVDLYSQFKKKRRRIPPGNSKALAKEWLQLQYGIKPLMSDLYDSVDRMKNGAKSRPMVMVVRASSSASIGTVRYLMDPGGKPFPFYQNRDVRVSVVGYSFMKNDFLHDAFGDLGLTNPLSLAWEKIPYSFVVDWWINAGEYLASLDNCLYFEGSIGTISTKEKFHAFGHMLGGSGEYFRHILDRGPAGAISPVSDFVYKPSLSLTHILNGLALLRVAR